MDYQWTVSFFPSDAVCSLMLRLSLSLFAEGGMVGGLWWVSNTIDCYSIDRLLFRLTQHPGLTQHHTAVERYLWTFISQLWISWPPIHGDQVCYFLIKLNQKIIKLKNRAFLAIRKLNKNRFYLQSVFCFQNGKMEKWSYSFVFHFSFFFLKIPKTPLRSVFFDQATLSTFSFLPRFSVSFQSGNLAPEQLFELPRWCVTMMPNCGMLSFLLRSIHFYVNES